MSDLSFEEFQRLSSEGNVIPLTRTLLADDDTPLSVYRKIRGQGDSFLFESVEGGEHLGRYSFVGCRPRAVIRQIGDRVEYRRAGEVVREFRVCRRPDAENDVRDGLEAVERILQEYRVVRRPDLPRFAGGAVGFIGYEFIHDVEPTVPRPPTDELGTPTIYLIVADQLLVFDRVSQTITLLANAFLDEANDDSLEAIYQRTIADLDGLEALMQRADSHQPVEVPSRIPDLEVMSNMDKATFLKHVERVKQYILAGDVIQVVGSQRFEVKTEASPLDVYRAARFINPSPYMFLLELDDFALAGASPEIHVRCEDRRVQIRPIAGTRPRGATEEEDLAHERDLLADPKERAEHVMLVDLARNDIGRVCDYGSVQVKDMMIIERYSHVMHIVSQVEGRLSEGKTPYDLMRATFPAGTLSGAPKVRAMQIIAEIEQTARGPYGGCVGYFSFTGHLDCCITIRTALMRQGTAYIQAGGGWVHDSTPEGEFQETVNKSRAMLRAIALAEAFS